jgi:hypothetical protein
MIPPQAARLADGRLHLQHGPIDLIVSAGPAVSASRADDRDPKVETAYRRASARFKDLLVELVGELPVLRMACPRAGLAVQGPVARRMVSAVRPFAPVFITPMAAVAGAVAEEIRDVMRGETGLSRIIVNNGGDIALYLGPGETARLALVTDPAAGDVGLRATIDAASGIAGIATSGRHGRSFSLGIADAVTIFAADAAMADAAATIIANAIDLPGSPKVCRRPANEIAPDSDLGARPVTTGLMPLTGAEIDAALDRGEAVAEAVVARGLALGALLCLGARMRPVGDVPELRQTGPWQAPLPLRGDGVLRYHSSIEGRNA